MKSIRSIYILSLALLFVAASCNDDDFVEYDEEIFQVVTDAYLSVGTPVVSFQAGTPSYDIAFDVVNGLKRVDAVEVYSTFTDNLTGGVSNEVLFKSYTMEPGNVTHVTDMITYDELKAGLTVDGEPLPDDELEVAIGSGWVFRFVGKSDVHGDIPLSGNIRVAVLSRFAGIYRVVESEYYRIGVFSTGWNGQTRFIGSVDETTYSYNDWWGNFGWAGNSFHFRIDEADNTITVPIIVSGLFSGNRALSCDTEPEQFQNVPCDGSNILIPDEVNNRHEIRLTYGYFTDGSGPREFWERLVKE